MPDAAGSNSAPHRADTALDTGATCCIGLDSTLIRRLDHRPEQPMTELREYARQRPSG
ncbi:hypothetical protein AB0I22_14810 [Streptomyces sp. NPDC050610]|uniref:hypothetical protein n=1 Tax=Streptomyces sp. NPDC050610 TaxID=3157097 RepID=UPI00342DD540